ncbi:recombinase, phage RecT family protein [Anoxybacillus sp. B7M1]|uniref:recombination protein RecT n=1 Tax=unclassified Anoxybacillus TaxID=2639704 RepID=UPI0005CCEC33|nr:MULTISPECIES: recombination protein RecT [unclassified Anoxybacillus]ANB55659.1 recombinase, phage RecT family protein [Anoxybacillus sp. B2M1]ANB62659.1 recombinase, phage RecT family protein [Anoxybacillus sp. B7M1]
MTQAEKIKNQLVTKANGGQVTKKQNGGKVTVADLLQQMKPELERALPKHLNGDRLIRIALTEMRRNPELLSCEIKSLLGAIMQAAQLGLEPGLLGHCYLIPFKNRKNGTKEVQFVIGYKGLIDLVRRSGEVETIKAEAVYENDEFEFEYGLDERLRHKPLLFGDRGKLIGFYAYAKFKDGGHAFHVMSVEEINRLRDKYSRAKESGPWREEYEAMAKKTVIRQLIKYLPISIEIQRNVSLDETVRRDFNEEPEHVEDYVDMEAEYLEGEVIETEVEGTVQE